MMRGIIMTSAVMFPSVTPSVLVVFSVSSYRSLLTDLRDLLNVSLNVCSSKSYVKREERASFQIPVLDSYIYTNTLGKKNLFLNIVSSKETTL